MGELKVETDALLRDNNFASDEFSDAVTRSVNLDEWSLEKEDQEAIATRRDFRDEKTFTIDPNGANDLDDAIHVKNTGDGKIEIGIHIADVAHFIKANSLVDREAKKRGTAVYLMNRSCNMLPPKIATDVCSLTPGQERLTVSVVFQVNAATGVVVEDATWIGKSVIRSVGKLSYKQVDAILSGHTDIKIDGAEVKDILILNVSFESSHSSTLLICYRPFPKNSVNNDLDLMERLSLHSDSSINSMMRMFQLNTTFLIPLLPMNSLRSCFTRQIAM